ncbi:YjzC family protein [Paenibacillus sp. CGMCC 1.16610]|uniref:YjzC family protein n=4 Tax=Paenibacillus TaxID=44249 RepID=A0ABU3RNT7_9BACL|nr:MULTISPECIES: YjzC family protein [Paenibacillus]MBA2941973.1 YjzC family protein [Paenibacillus sp. CGMCC 1.16610]MCY9662377.1 YjzC family protein [Paenibacillus anseongense]MDU0205955.1 YjzC family protein [Paenibacillus sp. PFR10]MEB4795828.1 YjzC family protein [Paenibacillus chondroitinus]MEC0269260.1 YjzC family protein [Paenibacillus anseongense]
MANPNHRHKTGEKVTEAGHYIDGDGGHVVLQAGDTFPNCPKTGKATTWKHEA